MKRSPKVGLLPFYLKLYDETNPNLRKEFEPFIQTIENGFSHVNVNVVRAKICRIESEFHEAMQLFENRAVDLIVTLHLAYSPSLESIEPLSSTNIPILILDTTMDYEFGPNIPDPGRLMFNHGIHGVQDFACMLRRKQKPFAIIAGHVTESNVIQRAVGIAKAAYAARLLKTTKALRMGESFHGMGDFAVSEDILLEKLGISVDQASPQVLIPAIQSVTDSEIQTEIQRDRERYHVEASEAVHRRSVRLGLGLRRYLDQENYSAFSMNFLAFNSSQGLIDTVPFLEISKSMARGLGYAGEGDVLTAALVGALNQAFGKTTFTEIFCPDWKGGSLFLSHMGEVNPEIAAGPPLLCEKDFPWTPAQNPAVLTCAPAPGPATLVNLAPGPQDSFSLIVSPVEVLNDSTNPAFQGMVRGWIQPSCGLASFLEEYSRCGGTHHSALMLGNQTEALSAFASYLAIDAMIIPAKGISR